MYLKTHCHVIFMCADFRSVDVKNGKTPQDWTPDTRDTEWVLKWALVQIAAFHYPIWIPEIEHYQKVSSHAQI